MEAIDELISAAQTFYDDARANENGRSRSWEHCYRVFRDARTDPSPDYDYLSLHLAFYLASWGMYRGSSFLLEGLQGAHAHRRGDPEARIRLPVWARVHGSAGA